MEAKKVKAGMGYAVGNILIKGISFLTLPVFTRLMDTRQFGIYNAYCTYESILQILFCMGLQASIKNANLDYKGRIKEYMSTITCLSLIPMILTLLFFLLFGKNISGILEIDGFLMILLLFQSYGASMLTYANALFAISYSYTKYLLFAAFNCILNVLLSVIFMITVFDGRREYGRISGAACPLIVIGAYLFFTTVKAGKNCYNKEMGRYSMKIGLPLIWHYLALQIQSQFDRIAIMKLIGKAESGIYSFSYTIASIFQILVYSIENVWTIWMFDCMERQDYQTIKEAGKKYIGGVAALGIAMMVCSKELIWIMGSEVYWEGADIFVPILIGLFFLFLYTKPVSVEYYYKATKGVAVMTIFAAVANVGLNFWLIPIMGYPAAAYTTLLTYALQFFAHWWIASRILKKNNISCVYSFCHILCVLSVVFISGLAVLLLNSRPFLKYAFFIPAVSIYGYWQRKDIQQLLIQIMKRTDQRGKESD